MLAVAKGYSQTNQEKKPAVGGLGNPCPVGVDCEGDFINPTRVKKSKPTKAKEQEVVKTKPVQVKKKRVRPKKENEIFVDVMLTAVEIKAIPKNTYGQSASGSGNALTPEEEQLKNLPAGWDKPPVDPGFVAPRGGYNVSTTRVVN